MLFTRKSTIAMVMLSILVVLSACNSGGKEGANKSASPSAAVNLGITWWGGQARHDATLKAIDLYKQRNSGVTFEPTYMDNATYLTKLATLAAAKALPDIMQTDITYLAEYASRGMLADVSTGINLNDVDKKMASSGVLNGKTYGIPIGVNMGLFFYNKSALDKLGVAVPAKGFSWDEFLAKAKEIKPKLEKGKYVLADMTYSPINGSFFDYEKYQLAQGKGFLHTADGKLNFDKDTFIAFHKLFADLRKDGIVPPPDVTASNKQSDPKLDLLINGTVLFMTNALSVFPAYDAVSPGNFAMTAALSGKSTGTYTNATQYFTISKDSKNIDAAKKFIDYFINDKEAAKVLLFQRGLPVSKPINDLLAQTAGPVEKQQIEAVNKYIADSLVHPNSPIGFGGWSEEFDKTQQDIVFGKTTPEKGYDQLKKQWDEMVKN